MQNRGTCCLKKGFLYGKTKGNFCARKSKENASLMKMRSTLNIVFALSLVSPIFWRSVILLTRVWAGPVRVGLDTIHAAPVWGLSFACSISVRYSDWHGACERLPLVRAGMARVVPLATVGWVGWEVYILVFCFLLDSACPFISFR